jgi:hypothetical protein
VQVVVGSSSTSSTWPTNRRIQVRRPCSLRHRISPSSLLLPPAAVLEQGEGTASPARWPWRDDLSFLLLRPPRSPARSGSGRRAALKAKSAAPWVGSVTATRGQMRSRATTVAAAAAAASGRPSGPRSTPTRPAGTSTP